jgi:putative iron-dependent peroxidase
VTVAEAVGAFRRLRRTPDVSAGGVNLVIAFGADAWREGGAVAAPADLAGFTPIAGADGYRVPASQHGAWLWISGAEPDATWQSARAATQAVGPAGELAAEQPAFT